jgi:transposase-like protein
MSEECPRCKEEIELEPWAAGCGGDGEIVDDRAHCHWCERNFTVRYKVSFEVDEVKA